MQLHDVDDSSEMAEPRKGVALSALNKRVETGMKSDIETDELGLLSGGGCGRHSRGDSRRADVQQLMERLMQRGRQSTLTHSSDGEHEYAELTYERPSGEPKTVKFGWAVGEDDNKSIAYTWLALELLAALSE